jgi:hypothetical protein
MDPGIPGVGRLTQEVLSEISGVAIVSKCVPLRDIYKPQGVSHVRRANRRRALR